MGRKHWKPFLCAVGEKQHPSHWVHTYSSQREENKNTLVTHNEDVTMSSYRGLDSKSSADEIIAQAAVHTCHV